MLPVFFHQTPFFRFLLPFIGGIVLGFQLTCGAVMCLFACIILTATLFCLQWKWKKLVLHHFEWIYGSLFYLLLFVMGVCAVSLHRFHPSEQTEQGVYLAVVEEPPVERENSMKATILLKEYISDSSRTQRQEKIMAYIRKDAQSKNIRQGDLLLFKTTVKPVVNAGNPYEFDYRGFLNKRDIARSAFIESGQWQRIGTYAQGPLVNLSNRIRYRLLDIFKEAGLEGNELAVASALTLGYKADLSDDLRSAYSASGAMHVLAVSGLHVGILYFVLEFLLKLIPFLHRRKWLFAIVMLAVLWLYAFITGLPPSVKRAATMFSVIVIGQALYRKAYIYNSIAISAFILLLLNPMILYDVGFQLSYTAVIAIVFFHSKLYPLLSFDHILFDKAWSLTCVSLAAQIGTAPLALYYFHQFPIYFILSNFIVIPAASVIIYGALILFVLSPVSQLLEWCGWMFDKILYTLNTCIFFIEKLPGSLITGVRFQSWEIWLWFMLIASVSVWLLLKRKAYLFSTLGICLIWLAGTVVRDYHDLSRQQMMVLNAQNNSLFMFIDGHQNEVWYESRKPSFNPVRSTADQRIAMHLGGAHLNSLESSLHRTGIDEYIPGLYLFANFIQFENKQLAIFTREYPPQDVGTHTVKVNIVVLAQNVNARIEQIVQAYHPEIIVIDASNSLNRSDRWEEDCRTAGVKCHRISRDGAFVFDVH